LTAQQLSDDWLLARGHGFDEMEAEALKVLRLTVRQSERGENLDTIWSRERGGSHPPMKANVCKGSIADMTARLRHVGFTSDSGHSSVQVRCPKSASSGHPSYDATRWRTRKVSQNRLVTQANRREERYEDRFIFI
jgi:hypothetical protein